MTDELRAVLQYRALLMALYLIMSLSLLVAPIGVTGENLFYISISIILIVVPLQTVIDIQDLLKADDEAK